MTREPTVPQQNSPWLAQTLRLTTYQLDFSPIPNQPSIWSEITGESPNEEQSRPKEGRFLQRGRFGGWGLDLNGQPGRVDWLLNFGDQGSDEDHTISIFRAGAYEEGIQLLTKIAEKWFEHGPPMNRIAFGAVLLQPVDDLREGFGMIDSYLPRLTNIYSESSTDFLFQINRPRTSGIIPPTKINRLSKWNVIRLGLATVHVGIAEQLVTSVTPDAEAFAFRLELDVNTPAELRDELPESSRMPMLSEMIELGREISEKGDVE